MRGFLGRSAVLTVISAALAACTTASSGGSAGLYCSVEGLCPPGMVCNAAKVCVAELSDASGGQDTAAADTAGSEIGQGDTAQNDTAIAPDILVQDTNQPDTAKPDTNQPDTAKPDTAQVDSSADVAPVAVTIEELQKGATSLSCENPAAAVNYSKVILEPAVLTGAPVMLTSSSGKKSALLYVRPATGPTSGAYAGMLIVVQAWPVPFTAGSVVQATGTVQEFYCMTEVMVDTLDAIVAKGTVAVPNPYNVGIATLAADPEPYEGALVSVGGVEVGLQNLAGSDGKNHGEFTVKSGNAEIAVFLPYGSQWLNKDQSTTLLPGSVFQSITGHLAYSFGHWVIRARDDADLQASF